MMSALKAIRRYPLVPLFIILAFAVMAIFGSLITPQDPFDQDLPCRLDPPVWGGEEIDTKTVVEEVQDSSTEISLDRAERIREGTCERQTPEKKDDLKFGDTIQVVSKSGGKHLFGADQLGRDILSRIMLGARISLQVGVVSLAVGAFVGTVLGIFSAHVRGITDTVLMRVVDATLAFPLILPALLLVVLLGASFGTVVLALTFGLWARFARIMRGDALSVETREFVTAAEAIGCSSWRIMSRHIFPNVASTLLVLLSLQLGWVILVESTLSFLGAGIPPPEPSWGRMVAEGRDYVTGAWWVSFFPGVAIVLVVLSANLIGDWIRDALDPRLKNVQ